MITNASPLIHLGRIHRLDLLRAAFSEVVVPDEVHEEVVTHGLARRTPDAPRVQDALAQGWLQTQALDAQGRRHKARLRRLHPTLGDGEAAAITLALARSEREVLLDDALARHAAKLEGLTPRGTLRVLVLAYHARRIDRETLQDTYRALTATGFWVSAAVSETFWSEVERLDRKR